MEADQGGPFVTRTVLRPTGGADRAVALTAYSPLGGVDGISDAALAEIGDRYDESAAQIALRWLVQQELLVAIPGVCHH